ncbi:hypothetical protein [Sphingomonas sp. M1-B02]|uniref:hypothetical protein n=1 Tax=Sphingomonas sp. M1-B02 TaxID=3114300 RepID=UPI00223EFD7B|nr:hypothetical protein [Sphingomonas sp. S6-11]UZK65867.1 hypothetical protein OKW87_15355 [Sphingomonas sp. S6-11]
MSLELNNKVTPSLHPANVTKIDGYSEATQGYAAGTERAFHEAYSGVASVFAAREAAKRDLSLTEAARVIKVDDMAQRVFSKVARLFDTERRNLDNGIAQLEAELTAPVAAKASHPVAAEVRAYVRTMSPPERVSFVYHAINNGDDVTATAVLGAPSYLSGIEANVQAVLVRTYHEVSAPAEAAKLKTMQGARTLIEKRGGLLFTQLEEAVGAQPHEVRKLREAKARSDKAFAV